MNQLNIAEERSQWDLIREQAETLRKSGAISTSISNAEQAIAIIQYGRELGFLPMTALQNISLIQGKPTLSANLIGGLIKKAGYNFKILTYTDKEVKIKFQYPDGDSVEISYTMEEAKQAGNTGKQNYSKYSKEMLYARCLTRGGRIVAPEVLAGVYAPEEFNEESTASFDKQGETNPESKNEELKKLEAEEGVVVTRESVKEETKTIEEQVKLKAKRILNATKLLNQSTSVEEFKKNYQTFKDLKEEPEIKKIIQAKSLVFNPPVNTSKELKSKEVIEADDAVIEAAFAENPKLKVAIANLHASKDYEDLAERHTKNIQDAREVTTHPDYTEAKNQLTTKFLNKTK